MGAWGTGLQANDTALDAIDEKQLNRICQNRDKKSLKKHLEQVKKNFGSEGVLGVVEWLLDVGIPHTFFDTCRPIVDEAIKAEKEQHRLDDWQNPEARRRTINIFRKRIQGKKVSTEEMSELNESNKGLLAKVLSDN